MAEELKRIEDGPPGGNFQRRQSPPPRTDYNRERREADSRPAVPAAAAPADGEKAKTLWLRFPSMDSPAYRRLKLILVMFVGDEPLRLHFADTKKTLAGSCWIHPSLLREVREMLGEENVILK